MKSKILGLLAVGLLMGPALSQAAIMTYYATGTFSDGGTLSGSFQADPTDLCNNLSLPANLVTTGSTTRTYTILAGASCSGASLLFYDVYPALTSALSLIFNPYLTGNGSYEITSASAESYSGGGLRYLTGQVSTSPFAVPEPGTLALLGLGLTGLALSRRRKAV